VKFDRVLDAFDGPFERVSTVSHPHGGVAGAAKPAGYVVSHHQNDAFVVVNRIDEGGRGRLLARPIAASGGAPAAPV
jgi:hypothetical protein